MRIRRGKNTRRIAEYIKNSLKEDQPGEQLVISEVALFKGGKYQFPCSWRFDICAKNRGFHPHMKDPSAKPGVDCLYVGVIA